MINKYGFLALPIVDNESRLVGIVTVDDAIDVLEQETDEDISKMAAITPTETSYLKTSALTLFRARIPWLLLLMISATVSSTILGFFEASLLPVLVLFVPMLMDSGGNSGSQASVTAIRALSVGEIELSDVFRVLWKEIRVGALCGGLLGAVAFGKVMLVDRLIMGNPEVTLAVALSVAAALALTVLISKLIGAILPILARALHLDPAVMASPFITTAVDALSLVTYFLIASVILP
jgi:magnesium transporter